MVGGEDDFDGLEINTPSNMGCKVAIANVLVDYDDRTERTANAHLIAAAPDLYEALKNLTDKLSSEQYLIHEDLIYAIQALAKAEGRTC